MGDEGWWAWLELRKGHCSAEVRSRGKDGLASRGGREPCENSKTDPLPGEGWGKGGGRGAK